VTIALLNSDRLIVVVGPSGAGKDSVLNVWRQRLPPAATPAMVRRVITRAPDPLGENHEPIDHASFARLCAGNAFAFCWHAHGLHYGVRHTSLAPLAEGRWVVMNGSRGHLSALRRRAPHAHVVEITAPVDVRAERLASRRREAGVAVAARLERKVPVSQAALVVDNTGCLDAAVEQLDRWWRGRR